MRKGALPATAPSPYRRSVANAPSASHSAGMPRRRPWIAVCEAALTLTPKKRNVEMLPGMRKQTRVRKGALPATAPSPHRRSVANALSACQPAGMPRRRPWIAVAREHTASPTLTPKPDPAARTVRPVDCGTAMGLR